MKHGRNRWTIWMVGAACASIGLGAGALAAGKKEPILIPIPEAKFVPRDPAQPNGTQIAVLSGDPTKGPSSILMKLKKFDGVLHTHTADYHAVLIQGSLRHWYQGQEESSAATLSPGSYWFEPGNHVHGDSCLSDECLLYVSWSGKMDGRRVEPAKTK